MRIDIWSNKAISISNVFNFECVVQTMRVAPPRWHDATKLSNAQLLALLIIRRHILLELKFLVDIFEIECCLNMFLKCKIILQLKWIMSLNFVTLE